MSLLRSRVDEGLQLGKRWSSDVVSVESFSFRTGPSSSTTLRAPSTFAWMSTRSVWLNASSSPVTLALATSSSSSFAPFAIDVGVIWAFGTRARGPRDP